MCWRRSVAHREACSQHEQALGCFETKRQELGQELNLAIDNEASLSAELDRSKQQVAQLEQERLNLEQQFLQELLTEVALPKEGRLAELLQDFAQTSQEMQEVRCPRCQSNQISTQKKGMSGGSACCGALLVGPLGLLCGLQGANKVIVTCLKCGHQWSRG